MADIAAGDYASAVGRLSGTAVDLFLGAKGLGNSVEAIENVALRNVDNVATNSVRAVDAGLVSFGRNANQNQHTWRHIDDIGMERTRVQNSVLDDIPADLPAGPHQRRITVDGVELEYRIFKFDDGSFNVGTIFDP